MSYRIDFTRKAQQDMDFHKKSGNMPVLKKLLALLEELSEHPKAGTGKPELLKHQLSGLWSRRINGEHRLVYEILAEENPEDGIDGIVVVHSAKGHY
jgi:toxin YoeB